MTLASRMLRAILVADDNPSFAELARDRCKAARRSDDVVAVLFERRADELGEARVVIGDEDRSQHPGG